jgi:uncharacterized membrane protein YcgQ (UPF0703/DUF1980 family)
MSVRAALAFAGGAAVASALDGAARSLTAASPALTFCAGAALIILSVQANNSAGAISWRKFLVATLAGGCAGLSLLCTAPAAPRDVTARVPRNHVAADLFDTLDRLDADPAAFDRRIIDVSGTWTPATAQGAATISRRVMSCCAADAIDVGFDVIPSREIQVPSGQWVRAAGRVRVRLRNGELRYEIFDAAIRKATP